MIVNNVTIVFYFKIYHAVVGFLNFIFTFFFNSIFVEAHPINMLSKCGFNLLTQLTTTTDAMRNKSTIITSILY